MAPNGDERAVAVHGAIPAARRKSLESFACAAYSAFIDNAVPHPKDRTMNAATPNLPTRLTAFAVAVLTSAVVLGATVTGMQPRAAGASQDVVAMERVTITAPRIN
jgi:hypothetical protein